MKNIFLFLTIVTIIISTGCASNRTAPVGYRYDSPVLTTNVTRTVTRKIVDGKPMSEEVTENVTITSTQPVQRRTWAERATGRRPFAETQVIPSAAGTDGPNEYPSKPTPRSYGSNSGYSNSGYNGGGYNRPPIMYVPHTRGLSVGGSVTTLPSFQFNN
ncbi:MAG: hypothetical protein COV91_03710 [Candidatus Taylorbacteria bacterium CG11_big_fil_rev_8_21_14_0_20_46_11]|uniref:Uncharacterized protein n=1 Tax=Candidatus Taylorbacteria bacterium CG11_big_fil_rev_8_21_14_0_20_46_11 TaxID=1975025 RepID=A0A2H0KDQ4_9BACT|nr:MAG: hypothetical protein COV91_03710 [Candidatus Taylorbacteria bacterium CG11_big_fil_rev_8_21_14_0_20_46_11]